MSECINLTPGFKCSNCPTGFSGNDVFGVGVEGLESLKQVFFPFLYTFVVFSRSALMQFVNLSYSIFYPYRFARTSMSVKTERTVVVWITPTVSTHWYVIYMFT